MRPRFRASTVVYAARYAPTADALGSMQPGYAAARHALRGTLLPSQDGADPTAAGLRRQEELVLLLPLGAAQVVSTDSCEQDRYLQLSPLIVYMYSKKLLTSSYTWYYKSRN